MKNQTTFCLFFFTICFSDTHILSAAIILILYTNKYLKGALKKLCVVIRESIWDPGWGFACLCVWVAWVSRVRAGQGGQAGGGEWGARNGHVPLPSLMSGHDQRLEAVLIWTLKVRLHATLFLSTRLHKGLCRKLSSVCEYEDSGLTPCDLYASQGRVPSVAILAVAPPNSLTSALIT